MVLRRLAAVRRLLGVLRRDRSGQALVEFAIVLPLLLLLLVGIIEMAGAWRTLQVITNASREAARTAVVPLSSAADIQDILDDYLLSGGLDPTLATVAYRCDDEDGLCPGVARSGRTTEVELSYPYTFRSLGPLLNLACGGCGTGWGTIPLRSATIMRNE
jgi:hypothetical protein